jgi:hypothetical protein
MPALKSPIRTAASVVVCATLVCLPAGASARDSFDANAFAVFMQSLASQRIARLCARSMPDYPARFDVAFASWSARHRDAVERGNAAFRAALKESRRTGKPSARLEQIAQAVDELEQPPVAGKPIADERFGSVCEQNIAELGDAPSR